jgi:hypothetical protein
VTPREVPCRAAVLDLAVRRRALHAERERAASAAAAAARAGAGRVRGDGGAARRRLRWRRRRARCWGRARWRWTRRGGGCGRWAPRSGATLQDQDAVREFIGLRQYPADVPATTNGPTSLGESGKLLLDCIIFCMQNTRHKPAYTMGVFGLFGPSNAEKAEIAARAARAKTRANANAANAAAAKAHNDAVLAKYKHHKNSTSRGACDELGETLWHDGKCYAQHDFSGGAPKRAAPKRTAPKKKPKKKPTKTTRASAVKSKAR